MHGNRCPTPSLLGGITSSTLGYVLEGAYDRIIQFVLFHQDYIPPSAQSLSNYKERGKEWTTRKTIRETIPV